jgi:predicted Zn-dependent protease
MRVARVVLLALSLVAIAWFVLGARQARDISQVTAIVQGSSVTAAQARQANQRLDSAATLDPDREVALLRAVLASERNHEARARTIVEQVTRAEPDNIVAWDLLVQLAGHNVQLLAKAFAHVAQLKPTVPSRG